MFHGGRDAVRVAWRAGARHPETPRWRAREGRVAFIDGATGTLLEVAPGAAAGSRTALAAELGFIVVGRDGGLLFGTGTRVLREGAAAPFAVIEGDAARLRLNDAGLDDAGYLWTGTMDRRGAEPLGALWRVDPQGRPEQVASGFTIPNGFAFSLAGDRLFVADSPRRVVHAFALDAARGVRGRDELIGAAAFGDAYPDGMAVDAEDHVWIACYDGGCVKRFRPDGSLERTVRVPAAKATACAFGGADLATLFVTAGDGLYAFEPGVRGAAPPLLSAAARA